jgi:hypothetical protein
LYQGNGTIQGGDIFADVEAQFPATQQDNLASYSVTINGGEGNETEFIIVANSATLVKIYPLHRTKPDGTPVRTLDLTSPELNFDPNDIAYEIRKGHWTGITPERDANFLVFVKTWEHILAGAQPPVPLDSKTLETFVHESMHSFGLHHNCGNRDISNANACVGNWRAGIVFDPFERLNRAYEFCSEHIRAIRESDGFGGE